MKYKGICKEFSIKKCCCSVEDQCNTEKTNSIERKIGGGRLKQNRKHVTELICSQEGNLGLAEVQEK